MIDNYCVTSYFNLNLSGQLLSDYSSLRNTSQAKEKMAVYAYILVLIVPITSTYSQEAQRSVTLSCALRPPRVYLAQRVIFNCTVNGTGLLEWIGPDYIGDTPLEIVASDSAKAIMTSPLDPSTVARRLYFNQTMILSSLEIVGSLLQTSSVTCRNVGTEHQETLTFHGVDNVELTGPLSASFGQKVIFTCTVRGSGLLEWSSPMYAEVDDHLEIVADDLASDIVPSSKNSNIYATRLNHTIENGAPVLVSELHVHIMTSELFSTTVMCRNTALNTNKVIPFETVARDSDSSATAAASDSNTTLNTSSSVFNVMSPSLILFPVLLSTSGLDIRVNP